MKKILILFILIFILTGCVFQNNNSIATQKINNASTTTQTTENELCLSRGCKPEIKYDECVNLNGEVVAPQSGYCDLKENFLGTVVGVLCPCICCKK